MLSSLRPAPIFADATDIGASQHIGHATFVIERSYPAAPPRVFAAWAFLDGLDSPEAREEGTASLLDNLGKYLAAQAGQ